MKTTAITFALLVATLLNANASSSIHKKSAKINQQKTTATPVEHHGPKAKKANHAVVDDVMYNRF